MNRLSAFAVFFLCFVACGNRSQPESREVKDTAKPVSSVADVVSDTFSKGVLLLHITCLADALQSYALYVPAIKKDSFPPVIFCFDPHGDGSLPLTKYKYLADASGFILIGSNNSKNGTDWKTTQSILNTLFTDVQNRLSFNRHRMYACGFSGGAKVAGYAALHQSGIRGIITAGAGLPDGESLRSFPFSVTALAGRGDMNMTDLVAMNAALDQTSTLHRLILFNGIHAWPPMGVMQTAFAALQLDAVRDGTAVRNDTLIYGYQTAAKAKIKTEEAFRQWLPAEQTCALSINLLRNVADAGWFAREQALIKRNPAYAQQQQESQQLLARENQMKQTFQQQFSAGDDGYWQRTIVDLQKKAKAATPEGAMYKRLLAYLSLAFYSISNGLINSHQDDGANHFVALYKLADATNPEALYFSAILNARKGNAEAVQSDLVKAVTSGFTDTTRLRSQPEFRALASQLHLDLIESKMKK